MFIVLFSDTVRLAIRKITYAPERPLPKVSVVTAYMYVYFILLFTVEPLGKLNLLDLTIVLLLPIK